MGNEEILNKFKRMVRKPVEFEITNEEGEKEIFKFKPLNTVQLAMGMALGRSFEKDKEDKTKISTEGTKLLFDLLRDIVLESYPEIGEKLANEFVASNLETLQDVLEKLMPVTQKKETLDKIKEKLKNESG